MVPLQCIRFPAGDICVVFWKSNLPHAVPLVQLKLTGGVSREACIGGFPPW